MAKERKSFLLRVDPKLHDALRRWAEDEFRSLNAQTEMILRRALQEAGRLKDPEDDLGSDQGHDRARERETGDPGFPEPPASGSEGDED